MRPIDADVLDQKIQEWIKVNEEVRVNARNMEYTAGYDAALCAVQDFVSDMPDIAYSPAHIDQEEWEPCIECAPNCSWCKHYQEIAKTIPDVCRECKHYSNYEPEYNFCCECGRPLTPEAWAELEKRRTEMDYKELIERLKRETYWRQEE